MSTQYVMKAFNTTLNHHVYWSSINTIDSTGAKSGYPIDQLTDIVVNYQITIPDTVGLGPLALLAGAPGPAGDGYFTAQVSVGNVTAGKAALLSNGKIIPFSLSTLQANGNFAGIALSSTNTGLIGSIRTQGPDSSFPSLGDGYACAVGCMSDGTVCRVTDSGCISGLTYLGYCDGYGIITVAPRTAPNVNIQDFGAVGDGTTDDTSSIQIAINLSLINGGTVYLPAPTTYYKCTSNITLIASNNSLTITGESPQGVTLESPGTFIQFTNGGFVGNNINNIQIKNLAIKSANAPILSLSGLCSFIDLYNIIGIAGSSSQPVIACGTSGSPMQLEGSKFSLLNLSAGTGASRPVLEMFGTSGGFNTTTVENSWFIGSNTATTELVHLENRDASLMTNIIFRDCVFEVPKCGALNILGLFRSKFENLWTGDISGSPTAPLIHIGKGSSGLGSTEIIIDTLQTDIGLNTIGLETISVDNVGGVANIWLYNMKIPSVGNGGPGASPIMAIGCQIQHINGDPLWGFEASTGAFLGPHGFRNTLNYQTVGDGITNDSANLSEAITDAISRNNELLIPAGTIHALGSTITFSGSSIKIKGQHRLLSGLIALTSFMTMLDITGAPGKSLIIEDIFVDANGKAFELIVGGALFDSIEIRRCNFINMSSESAALSFGNLSTLIIDNCLFDGYASVVGSGILINGPIQTLSITNNIFRGLNTGISISVGTNSPSIQNINIENNTFDMMYYSAISLPGLSNSGGTVTYTSGTLVDSSKTFSLGSFGTIGTFNTLGYIRALTSRHSGTITSATRSQLIDTSASFTTYNIIVGEIIRCGSSYAIIISVEDDHHINIEEWLNQSSGLPTATPSGSYIIYEVILGRAVSATSHTITLDREWADLNGNQITPGSGTLYEIPATPNYPITTSSSARRVNIINNTVIRSYTDSISPFGDECNIYGNFIKDGQDVGITVDGSISTNGINGGQHNIHDNTIIRAGSEGIYYGGQFNPCIHHNRIFGWGARSYGISSPTVGESGIDLNPAAVPTIFGGIVDHNIIDGYGLPNSYYGISALDMINIDLDTNYIANVTQNDYNISGSSTSGCTIKHRTSSIFYSSHGGLAPGQTSNLIGSGSPLGVVIAGPGSLYTDTSNGLVWIKISGTNASGWQYISSTEFTPKSIPSGLQLWARADLGTTLSSSSVTAWADQSGIGDSNRNYTSSATHYPTLVVNDSDFNNQAALTFDPSSFTQYLQSGAWSTPLPAVSTWFWVAKARVSGIMVAASGIGSSNRQDLLANSSSFADISSGGDCISTQNLYSSARVVIGVFNGTSSKIYVSETTGESGGNPGSETLTGSTLGALYDASSFGFDGKIAEVASWNRVLTTNEIASLNTYASARYNISIGP